MPGRAPGTGFQRAWLTEMSPGNPKGNRAATPLVHSLDSWRWTIKGCYINFARNMCKTPHSSASAFSAAKSAHLLAVPWFPPGFKSLIWS